MSSRTFLNAWMAQCEVADAAEAAMVLGADRQLLEQCLMGDAELPHSIRRHAEWISSSL